MGVQSADAYGLGVSLAFAAYQASRVPPSVSGNLGPYIDLIAGALQSAKSFADELRNRYGIRGSYPDEIDAQYKKVRPAPYIAGDPHNLQAPLEGLRGDCRTALSGVPRLVDVFDLAVAIALTEAQSTGRIDTPDHVDPAAMNFARMSLQNAISIAQKLADVVPFKDLEFLLLFRAVTLDPKVVTAKDAQEFNTAAQKLRTEYQSVIRNSSLI